jgi:hypothetical protein
MDIKKAGTQKFFRIDVESRGGIVLDSFPCDGDVSKLVIVNREGFTYNEGGLTIDIGRHSFLTNEIEKIEHLKYKFKKFDNFNIWDFKRCIKEVILYFES